MTCGFVLIPQILFAQDPDSDWTLPEATGLREIADVIESARAEGDSLRVINGIEAFAQRLVDEIPDGGFSLSGGRSIGAGAYLSQLIRMLDASDQRKAESAVELVLSAALSNRRPAERSELERRIPRDFPFSKFAASAQRRHAQLLLELGDINAYVRVAGDELAPELRQLLERLRIGDRATPALDRSTFWQAVSKQRWEPWPRGDLSASWATPFFESHPALTESSAYLADSHELKKYDRSSGALVWSSPFLNQRVKPNPGELYRPAVFNDLIICANSFELTAIRRSTGGFAWRFPLSQLFAKAVEEALVDPAVESSEEVAKSELPAPGETIAVSVPEVCSLGVVVAAYDLRSDFLTGRIALIDATGETVWNRNLGSANGATYLGLGVTRPGLCVEGDKIYVLTQRGTLARYSVMDGALEWSTDYPRLAPAASRDALRYESRFDTVGLATIGNMVVTAPSDSNALFIFNSSGQLVAELPRVDRQWWNYRSDSEGRLLLATCAAHRVEFYRFEATALELTAKLYLPVDLPKINAPPVAYGSAWLLPHAQGFFRVNLSDDNRLKDWEYEVLGLSHPIAELRRLGRFIWAKGEQWSTVLEPRPPVNQPSGENLEAELATARELLRLERPDAFFGWIKHFQGEQYQGQWNPGQASFEALLAFTREAMERVRASYHRHPQARQRWSDSERRSIVKAIFGLLPPGDFLANIGVQEARRAASAGDMLLAAEVISTVVIKAYGAEIFLEGELTVPIEMVARRILQECPDDDFLKSREEAAQRALELSQSIRDNRNRIADSAIPELERCRRQYPLTRAGRQASLTLADIFYRQGQTGKALHALERVFLYEESTREGLEALFKYASLQAEEERYERAREILNRLRNNYADALLSTPRGEESVRSRVDVILSSLPTNRGDRAPAGLRQELIPAWRTPTNLLYQRAVTVLPLEDETFISVAGRNLTRRSAESGVNLWAVNTAPTGSESRPSWSRESAWLRDPQLVGQGAFVVHDRHEIRIHAVDSGETIWTAELDFNDPEKRLRSEIVRVVRSPECIVAISQDSELYGFDASSGVKRWKEDLSASPMGLRDEVEQRGSLLLFGFNRGRSRIELPDIRTGQLARTLFPKDELGEPAVLTTPPFFLDDHLICFGSNQTLVIYDLEKNAYRHRLLFGATIQRTYQFEGVPFFTVLTSDVQKKQALHGVSGELGRRLWVHQIADTRVEDVKFFYPGLYLLLERGFGKTITRLDLPKAFLREEGLDLLQLAEIDTLKWKYPLSRQYDEYRLSEYQDWILVAGELASTLTVLSKDRGLPIDEGPFRVSNQFLSRRQSLFFAEFVGDTLVLLTRRGDMGLRRYSAPELERELWGRVQKIDFARFEPQQSEPLELARLAYRVGLLEVACSALESAIDDPSLPDSERSQLSFILEGIAQELGERRPPRIVARQLRRPPTIDASLDEPWNAAESFPVLSGRYFGRVQGSRDDHWLGLRDQSALAFLGWSEEGFHLALDVTDDSVHPYDRDATTWQGDCLLMAFDFLGNGGDRARQDDQLFTLALTVPKPQQPPPAGEGEEDENEEEDEEQNKPQGEFQVRRKPDGSGVVYEVTIPWDTFRNARKNDQQIPFPGMEFRLNLLLTDDDFGTGATTYLSLSPGQKLSSESGGKVWDLFIPDFFPRIILE